MSALDSLVGLLELRKADALVLVAGEPPSLLGGVDHSLTMPPLDAVTMAAFLSELLSEAQRGAVEAGQVVEVEHRSARAGSFVVKARTDAGRAKLVIRRGALRSSAASASAPAPLVTPVPSSGEAPTPAPRPPAGSDDGLSLLAPLLERAVQEHASDLIVATGRAPILKRRGETSSVSGPALDDAGLCAAFGSHLNEERGRRLAETGSVDFGLDYLSGDRERPLRFRVNLFRRHGGLTAVLRPIWDEVPTLDQLGLPRTLRAVVESPNGLALFAGPTGSGKSTTLAALLEIVNQARACHILTLEDPIEYLFPAGRAVVHQREVGAHVRSFADGLRSALRESPDVILVGEMRDPETIALALTAAETGHLVLSTIHAGSAMGAIERVVNSLPEVERASMRTQLASVLRHVVVQHLLPTTEGGLVPAVGILVVNHAVASQIRDGRTQLLATQMEIGADEGMVTLEAALAELVRAGRITRETAFGATTSREALEASLGDKPPRAGNAR